LEYKIEKPSDRPTIKIADFGLARSTFNSNVEKMTGLMGTFVTFPFKSHSFHLSSIGWLLKSSKINLIVLRQMFIPLEYFKQYTFLFVLLLDYLVGNMCSRNSI